MCLHLSVAKVYRQVPIGLCCGFVLFVVISAGILAPLEDRYIREAEGSGSSIVDETYFRAFYFLLMTLISTSYLTLIVKSDFGKVFVIIFSFLGLVILFVIVDKIAKRVSDQMLRHFKQIKNEIEEETKKQLSRTNN